MFAFKIIDDRLHHHAVCRGQNPHFLIWGCGKRQTLRHQSQNGCPEVSAVHQDGHECSTSADYHGGSVNRRRFTPNHL